MRLRNTIIYLIGIPAVGKHTTALALASMTGARVVDNQLFNIPVFTVLGYDGTAAFPFPRRAWKHVRAIHKAVLAAIEELAAPHDSFLFTNVLDARAPGDRALFRRIEGLAKRRKAEFFPVWLTCSASALRRRKNTPGRKARLKDVDLTTISWWLGRFRVLKVRHRNALTLDTSRATAATTARRILAHVRAGRK